MRRPRLPLALLVPGVVLGLTAVMPMPGVLGQVAPELGPMTAGAFAAAGCLAVARRRADSKAGWYLLLASTLSSITAVLADAAWRAVYGSAPSGLTLSDLPGAASVVFAVLAVLSFLGPALSSAARMRTLMDGLLAALSLLLVSWTLVVEPVYRTSDVGPELAVALIYPIGNILILALLTVTAARVSSEARSTWYLLGSGLAVLHLAPTALAVLDLTGAPTISVLPAALRTLALGLIAVAAAQHSAGDALVSREPRPAKPIAILLPYLPFLIAGAVTLDRLWTGRLDTFTLVTGAVVLVILLARQLLAQFENLDLTRHLNSKVAERTAQLARRERWFAGLITNSSDLVTVLDADGVIQYQTPSVLRMLGFPTVQGRPLRELVHPDDRSALADRLSAAADADPHMLELRLLHRDGRWVTTETLIANLLNDLDVGGIVLTSRDVTDRKRLEDQLRHQAFHDPLTGLANRMLFHSRLDHAAARASRDPSSLAVLVIDLDGFKGVNDSLGHDAGDVLLREVAARLRSAVRPGDTVARLGGDEFAILLEDASPDVARIVAERILARLRAPVMIGDREIVSAGSVGVAFGTSSRLIAEELLRAADLAMYRAKTQGTSRYELFEASMQEAALSKVELIGDLRRAIRNDELVLHYQPIVDIPTGRIGGVEALLRWQHPEKGLLPPGEFVPTAEDSDLIVDLGRWVLRQACRDMAEWCLVLPADSDFFVSVNVAARQLATPWLVREVAQQLEATGIPPARLVLEVTEGAFLTGAGKEGNVLEDLRALGVALAIDDFGTGWSSLARLRSFPVDKLKIDRAFISEIASPADPAPMVDAILGMARSLGLSVVAEGVETASQLACLHRLGCQQVQGYLLARPMPADRLLALIREPSGMLGGVGPVVAAELEVEQVALPEVSEPVNEAEVIDRLLHELFRIATVDAVWIESASGEVLHAVPDVTASGGAGGGAGAALSVPIGAGGATAAGGGAGGAGGAQLRGVLAAGQPPTSTKVLFELFAMVLAEPVSRLGLVPAA